jgi:hypothetical protein
MSERGSKTMLAKQFKASFFAVFAVGSMFAFFMSETILFSEPGEPAQEVVAYGKELFYSLQPLNVKVACILCHKKEKAIKRSAVMKLGDNLPSVINQHILKKSKGKSVLEQDSAEMKALIAYILHEHSV